MNPFKIEGPACISFSGGKTSALMLRRCQEAGVLEDPSVHVLFCDTGLERKETYEFVQEVSMRWSIPITTLKKAHREGETPFDACIREKKYLPNPVTRFCTQQLKIIPMSQYMDERHGKGEWTNVVGLRADEPSRVARLKGRKDGPEISVPLYDAGIRKADVLAFWEAQPFKLRLREWEGNCDLCFLKGVRLRRAIMRDRPDLALWWIKKEKEINATFCPHSPDYTTLLAQAQIETTQMSLFAGGTPEPDELNDCLCTD